MPYHEIVGYSLTPNIPNGNRIHGREVYCLHHVSLTADPVAYSFFLSQMFSLSSALFAWKNVQNHILHSLPIKGTTSTSIGPNWVPHSNKTVKYPIVP